MDTIPEGYLTLTEAGLIFYNWYWRDAPDFGELPSIKRDDNSEERAWWEKVERRYKEAHEIILAALETGSLEALTQEPDKRGRTRILPEQWRKNSNFFVRSFLPDVIASFPEDPIANHDGRMPFLEETAFIKWLKRQGYEFSETENPAKASRGKLGRRTGVGGYNALDAPIIEEMRNLILNGNATSVWNAANQLSGKAAGKHSMVESVIRRLATKYRSKYPESENTENN